MLSSETLRKIQQLKIVTNGLMAGPFVGDDVSARKGYGVEFHQIREYQSGDDVRFIDWKSSCRLSKLLVKECLEERNRRIILAVDISGTSFYGSITERFGVLKEIATILAFAAQYAKDSVGLILFSDDIDEVYEPKNTNSYIQALIQKLHAYKPEQRKETNLTTLFNYIGQKWYKDATVFVISDFIEENFDRALRATAARVDVVAVRCYDPVERSLPDIGYLMCEDVESQKPVPSYINTQGNNTHILEERVSHQDTLFARLGIDVVDISYSHDACATLVEFFKKRMLHASLR